MPVYREKAEAPAKIKLFVDIVARRKDGFHELSTLMQKISLADTLQLAVFEKQKPSPDLPADAQRVLFEEDGCRLIFDLLSAEALPAGRDNSCVRAFRAFADALSPAEAALFCGKTFYIALEKTIPIQGGLGGGSADAAAVIRLLADYIRKEAGILWSEDLLMKIAAGIGADVPFCLHKQALCYCTGIGEICRSVRGAERPLPLLLLFPEIKVSTPEAFAAFDRMPEEKRAGIGKTPARAFVKAMQNQNYAALKGIGRNSFTALQGSQHPELISYINILYKAGADYAGMSGSGPSLFALFPDSASRSRALAVLNDLRENKKINAEILTAETRCT